MRLCSDSLLINVFYKLNEYTKFGDVQRTIDNLYTYIIGNRYEVATRHLEFHSKRIFVPAWIH